MLVSSKSDSRVYKHITLPNQLQCLLISDMDADKSAASLDVYVGSTLDPKPFFGTAHFLEHMLFMGSEKYPSENEYSEYIKDNGGYSNAYTSLTNTNYQFEIANEAMEGGLDRFAQFFISPLLGEAQTEREMKAVDSEWNMSLSNDSWRQFRVMQTLADPDSLLNRFTCGNLESLKRDGIRETLLGFHKQWYSANIMKLVISGKHSLEQLEQWAVEKFSLVVNKNVVVPDLGKPVVPFTVRNLATIQKYKPIQDKDQLCIYWILPYCQREFKSQPLRYFTHLFGHEGKNSILSYLKKEGYAMSLSAGEDHEMGVFSDFQVTVGLTKKGLENYEKVAQAVFKYAQRLVEAGPQDFVFEECRKLGQMKFDFADKGEAINYCVTLASTMQRFTTEAEIPHLLRHRYIADDFDKTRVQEFAKILAMPEFSQMYLTSQSLDEATLHNTEEWYKIKFSSDKYSSEFTQALQNPHVAQNGKSLDLPEPNTLLPTNFDILAADINLSARPVLLQAWEDTEVWYKKDDTFKRPKGIVSLKLYSNDNQFSRTAAGRLFVEVWKNCLDEFTREFSYTADCAGLAFSCITSPDNIGLEWSGYHSSLDNYVKQTIALLISMKTADLEEVFNAKKEELLQNYKNHYLNQTFRLAWGQVSYHIQSWNIERKLMRALLEQYSYQDFKRQLSEWLVSGRMVWGFFGNISTETALATAESVRGQLALKSTKREDLLDFRVISLPLGEQRLDFDVEDATNENSALVSYFQQGLIDSSDLVQAKLMDLTEQFLDEPTFNQLRTIEQLGYVVFTRKNETRDVQALQFCIQSPGKGCSHIKNSLDTHLANMREKAKNMTQAEFDVKVQSVLTNIEAKDKNLSEEHARLFGQEVSFHRYQFDRQSSEAKTLREITLAQWQQHFESLFGANCRRVDFRYNSHAHREQEAATEFKSPHQTKHESVTQFKNAMGLFADSIKTRYATKEFKL